MLKVDVELPRRDFVLDMQFEVAAGITGVYGRSGAGKSSLLNLLVGVERPRRGCIALGGRVLVDSGRSICVATHQRRVGMVFQAGRLFPHLSVAENLRYGLPRPPARPGAIGFDEVVERLAIAPLLDERPSHCSGGECQRVALGRALLAQPELLLLDEPLSAIDSHLRGQIRAFLRDLAERLGIPILIVSHDWLDLLDLCPRLLLVRHGRIVGHGSLASLCHEPELAPFAALAKCSPPPEPGGGDAGGCGVRNPAL